MNEKEYRQILREMSRNQLNDLSQVLKTEKGRDGSRSIDEFYPESGPLSRNNYAKHMEFFAAGAKFMERGVIAGNRTGKTLMSCFETTLHLTGEYPEWWVGRRFDRPVDWWAASDTSETTRDILQLKLMGAPGFYGTGLIPKQLLVGEPSHRRGVTGAVDTAKVQHKSGGISYLSFKSYDQGREKFQGTKKDGIQLDEEPPANIYFECLTRLSATAPGDDDGIMICTFTPLMGMSAVVLMFLNDSSSTRFVLTMGMNHAPHLSKETKDKLVASFPPHEREARMNGTPALGSGAIYPIPIEEILIPDFQLPEHFYFGYGMDVGWNRTSVGWHAWDRDNDIVYRTGEHYRGQAEPAIHAQAIRARGDWIPGVMDPAARGRSQIDGRRLMEIYTAPPPKGFGLNITCAKNAVEAGIYEMWQRLSSGRYKVFQSCRNFQDEYRIYRRDEDGKIVKEKDHAMDDARYFVMSGLEIARQKPRPPKPKMELRSLSGAGGEWMG